MIELNKYIDQTILKPEVTQKDILEFLEEVQKHTFYAAVVNPCWVSLARKTLIQDIKVCSVVGFPLGASSTGTKVYAAQDLISQGCDEIDMVMNIGRFRGQEYDYVACEIEQVVKAAQGKVVKVIIETCLLTDEEKKKAAKMVMENGAKYVKTSTGFSKKGAVLEDVRLLRSVVGPGYGVKASGGIRDAHTAHMFITAGADRLGTSAGVAIVKQNK